jgi:hypothetical protein
MGGFQKIEIAAPHVAILVQDFQFPFELLDDSGSNALRENAAGPQADSQNEYENAN